MRNKNYEFRVLKNGIGNTSEADRDRNIFYKCLICEAMILSTIIYDIHRECNNIIIEYSMHRLAVGDLTKIQISERAKKEK